MRASGRLPAHLKTPFIWKNTLDETTGATAESLRSDTAAKHLPSR